MVDEPVQGKAVDAEEGQRLGPHTVSMLWLFHDDEAPFTCISFSAIFHVYKQQRV